jgi:hypothetical protein
MLFRNMHFTSGEYVAGKSLFFTGEYEFFIFLEIEFVSGIDEAILGLPDIDIYVVVWFQLRIQKFSEVRYF